MLVLSSGHLTEAQILSAEHMESLGRKQYVPLRLQTLQKLRIRRRTVSTCPAVNEELIKQTADLVVSTGLREAGYKYLVIDGEGLSPGLLPRP